MTKISSSNLPFAGGEEKGSQFVVPRKYFVLRDGCNFRKFPPTWLKLPEPFFSGELTKGCLWEDPAQCLTPVKRWMLCLFFVVVMDHTVAACSSASSHIFSAFSVGQNEDPARCCFPPIPYSWKAQLAIDGEGVEMAPPNHR